jgi:putative ABC transport system permease protein
MIFLQLKLAFRNLVRNKVYSLLIIGGFAIGFTACILIGLFYHTETTVNNVFANHKNIYRIYDVKKNRCNMNWDLFPVLTSDYAAVDNACPVDYEDREQLTVKDEQTEKTVFIKYMVATTSNFFSIFSVDLFESSSGKPFAGRESIAISDFVARSLFGNRDPLGQKINVYNYFHGTVSSVFKEFPANTSFRADIILNSENEDFRFSTTTINGKRYNPTNHFVMLKDGTSPEIFVNELNKSALFNSLDIDSCALQRLDDIYLSELTVKSLHAKGNPVLLKVFLAVAALILFLSSINYLNYSVSMHMAKFRESGIKKTFGADHKNLITYSIIEVTLGMVISLLLALILTDLALSYSGVLFGKEVNTTLNDWLAVAPFFLAVLIVVIIVNSIAPIYFLSRYSITEFLSGSGAKQSGNQLWKRVLLTFQLTASTALIAMVIVIFKQLDYVKHSDTGFNKELLMRINIPYKFQQTNALQQELGKLSFVKSTTLSAGCPGMINHRMGISTGEKSFVLNCIYMGENYIKTMNIELIRGRDFLDGDFKKTCLLNEEALRQYGWDSFEGEKCDIGQDGGYDVVGIIKDFKFASFHKAVEPLALLFNGAEDGNVLSVRFTPGSTGFMIEQVNNVWNSISPHEPFSFIFYDDLFQSMYIKEAKLASSITFFSLIAIVLTCMGLLGQIFMTCLKRVKEIGVRRINGATIPEILVMLNRDFLIIVAVAFVSATPVVAVIMHKWLENFTYKTSLNWWIFALAGVTALFITLVTVSWQSWKASTRNPVEALRYE